MNFDWNLRFSLIHIYILHTNSDLSYYLILYILNKSNHCPANIYFLLSFLTNLTFLAKPNFILVLILVLTLVLILVLILVLLVSIPHFNSPWVGTLWLVNKVHKSRIGSITSKILADLQNWASSEFGLCTWLMEASFWQSGTNPKSTLWAESGGHRLNNLQDIGWPPKLSQ